MGWGFTLCSELCSPSPKKESKGWFDLREGVWKMEILEEERAKDVTCWLKVIKLRNQEAHG